jgi:hypothetical protein
LSYRISEVETTTPDRRERENLRLQNGSRAWQTVDPKPPDSTTPMMVENIVCLTKKNWTLHLSCGVERVSPEGDKTKQSQTNWIVNLNRTSNNLDFVYHLYLLLARALPTIPCTRTWVLGLLESLRVSLPSLPSAYHSPPSIQLQSSSSMQTALSQRTVVRNSHGS